MLYCMVDNIEKIVHYGMAALTRGEEHLFQTRGQNESVLRGFLAFGMRGIRGRA
jgi:hypothetical protein